MSKKIYTLGNSARWVVSSPNAQKMLEKVAKDRERRRKYFAKLEERKNG